MYADIDTGIFTRPARRWNASRILGTHLRGGAGSSVETLGSMNQYQSDPFILPSSSDSHHPSSGHSSIPQRPTVAARASSSRSIHTLITEVPYMREALGGASLAGIHGPPIVTNTSSSSTDRKESIGPHGRPLSRTPSGRPLPEPGRGVPPPLTVDSPTRMTRDSEDFSPVPDEATPNPFGDEFVEIPPSYHTVREVTRRRESLNTPPMTPPEGGTLLRSNALTLSRQSRRSERSTATAGHGSGSSTDSAQIGGQLEPQV